jgi:hypothetical protein
MDPPVRLDTGNVTPMMRIASDRPATLRPRRPMF